MATIPVEPSSGNDWGLMKFLTALDEVGMKLQVEVTGEPLEKKKNLAAGLQPDR